MGLGDCTIIELQEQDDLPSIRQRLSWLDPGRVALVRAAEELRAVLARHVREAVEATGQRLPADDGPDGHGSGSGQGRNASGPDRRGSDPDGHEGDRDECERRGDRS